MPEISQVILELEHGLWLLDIRLDLDTEKMYTCMPKTKF